MRCVDVMQNSLFTTVQLEGFVPVDHPIQPLREMFNAALLRISCLFDAAGTEGGRDLIAPERLCGLCCCKCCTAPAVSGNGRRGKCC